MKNVFVFNHKLRCVRYLPQHAAISELFHNTRLQSKEIDVHYTTTKRPQCCNTTINFSVSSTPRHQHTTSACQRVTGTRSRYRRLTFPFLSSNTRVVSLKSDFAFEITPSVEELSFLIHIAYIN
jgi:hypothetical protein